MPDFILDLPAGWYHLHLHETDSTMLRLRQADLMGRNEHFVLLTADYQTAGRGQRNTSWESDAEANLLFGFLFHPAKVIASRQFVLSEALALAVAGALAELTDDVRIKWPNDIYWRDRKICGMLLEHDLSGNHIATTITGVGINVNQPVFRSDAPNPVSLKQILGREVSREKLLERVISLFNTFYLQVEQDGYENIHNRYMQQLYRREGFHSYRDADGEFSGEIVDISPMGFLTLRKEDGSLNTYAFKEVSYVI